MSNFVKRLCSDESGATAVEYGIMVAGIAAVIVTVVGTIGSSLSAKFTAVNTSLQ